MEIALDDDAALILFDRLTQERENQSWGRPDGARLWADAELLGSLEKELVDPFRDDYGDRVLAAENSIMERYGEPQEPELEEVVTSALRDFIANDVELLRIRCHERTLTHRLAIYLDQRVRGWDVDCEYNRKGDEIKRLDSWAAFIEEKGLPPLTDEDRQYVNPDIIIHHRMTGDNLLVVEVKPPWSSRGRERDILKLLAMRTDLGYERAVYIELGFSEDEMCVVWL